jgi:hypothetical protein
MSGHCSGVEEAEEVKAVKEVKEVNEAKEKIKPLGIGLSA